MKTRIGRTLLLAAATCLAGLTLLLAAGHAAPAPLVTRGPYLQAAQPRAVSVAWSTDAVTEGLLQWRQEGGSWHDARDPAGPALRHEVGLPELEPGLAYEYRLYDGAGRLLVSGTSDCTKTVAFSGSRPRARRSRSTSRTYPRSLSGSRTLVRA